MEQFEKYKNGCQLDDIEGHFTQEECQYIYEHLSEIADEGRRLTLQGYLYVDYEKIRDISKAFECLKMAVEKGNSDAMNSLGCLFVNTNNPNIQEAIKYFKMAIEHKNVQAMKNLGSLYHFNVAYKNIPEAIKYYEMACNEGNDIAMNNLGYLYDTENHDIRSAIKYYQMAIEKGNPLSMNNLGVVYYYDDENKNIPEAIKYLEMATERGIAGAMNSLGNIYYEQNDIPKAIHYFKMAIKNGDKRSVDDLLESDKLTIKEHIQIYVECIKNTSNAKKYKNRICSKFGLKSEIFDYIVELKENQKI